MTSRQKVVAITGSSGQIGAKLLEHLEDTPGLGKLVAFDTRPMREPVHNIASFRKDVTTGIHEELLRMGATTVVHLAFRWKSGLRRREAATLSERNEKALRSVLDSCRRARVRHIIYLSSHTVYGARPDNPLPLHEDSPLRPSEGFPYAQDNYLAEKLLQEFAEEEPDIKLTIFRSCPALGAMSDTEILKEFYFPGWVGSSGHNPPPAVRLRRRSGAGHVPGDNGGAYRGLQCCRQWRMLLERTLPVGAVEAGDFAGDRGSSAEAGHRRGVRGLFTLYGPLANNYGHGQADANHRIPVQAYGLAGRGSAGQLQQRHTGQSPAVVRIPRETDLSSSTS